MTLFNNSSSPWHPCAIKLDEFNDTKTDGTTKQTQPLSSRGSACIARTERKSSQGKAEVGASVSISTTRGVMKGTYTLLNPSAPLIWNFICFCVDHSGYRGNLQRS